MKTKLMMIGTWIACLVMTACGGGKSRTAEQQVENGTPTTETNASVSEGKELGNDRLSLNDSLRIINTTLLQINGIDKICGNGYILTNSGGTYTILNMKGKLIYTAEYGKRLQPITDNYYPKFVPFTDKFFDGSNIIRCVQDSALVSTPVFDAAVDDMNSVNCTLLKDGNILVNMGEYGEQAAIYAPDGKRISDWHSYIVPIVPGKYLFEKDRDAYYLCDAKGIPVVDKLIENIEYHDTGLLVYKGENGLIGLLSVNGQKVTEPIYELLKTSKNLTKAQKDGVHGYLDYDLNFVPMDGYEEIIDFTEGYAAVKKDGKWGFVNDNLQLVVPCQYVTVGTFRKGVVQVNDGDQRLLINANNEKLFSLDRKMNNWQGRANVDFNILTWSYSDSEKNQEDIYSGNGLEMHAKKFKFARINGTNTVYASKFAGNGYIVTARGKRFETKFDDVEYVPGKSLLLVNRNGKEFFISYDGEMGYANLDEIDRVIQSNLQQIFDKASVIENIKNSLMSAKDVTSVYIFKDTYKFIGENKVYVEAAMDFRGAPMTAVYDVEVMLAPIGTVNDWKASFSWWMQSYKETEGVEFGVEEDVIAFLQSNTFVGASGMKINFIGSCMYMDGARVTSPLRVVLQPGIYSTAQLVGSNATLTVNGATGELINNADGNIYRKE